MTHQQWTQRTWITGTRPLYLCRPSRRPTEERTWVYGP
ncbi:hypothetical protein E2C01_056418 [Portunus trituberculatus]|uniref:Uncharacterized protein n=1 Tax=Portunus trituberculatus TaxID=210409 RepID=A0A5B7H0H1_PORTR|nr:hypothetical protein [Portunus trituberculatus]